MRSIAIDPGVCAGRADFDGQNLESCQVLPNREAWTRIHFPRGSKVYIEKPQVYPEDPVPPNDLITLALMVGKLAWEAEQDGCYVQLPTPHAWKGTVKKHIHNARVLKALTERERVMVLGVITKLPKAYRHNVIDAVGIGLWALQRMP